MNAVILAGGFGTRLKPLTDTVPKPMLPVANVPMLDYAVSSLYRAGVRDLVLTLGVFPEQITEWMGGYGFPVRTVVEDVPLGTAGGVRAAIRLLDATVLVVSGDAAEDIDYVKMYETHRRSGKAVTIAVARVADPRPFGLVEYDDTGTVTAFTEKPAEAGDGGIVSCGVYMIERSALAAIPRGIKYDFARDFFPPLVAEREVGVYAHPGYWSDLGSPLAYYTENFRALSMRDFPFITHRKRTLSRKLGQVDCSLAAHSALVVGKCVHSIVGEDATVPSDASVVNCIVLPRVTVHGRHYGEIVGEGFAMPVTSAAIADMPAAADSPRNFEILS